MEQNRFFLWTARINSILFLLLLLGSLGFLTFAIFETNQWSGKNTVEVVDDESGVEDTEDLRLSNINKVCGQDVQYVELYSYHSSKGFSSGGYGKNTRNVVFFVGQDMESHWLFDVNKYLISTIKQLKTRSDKCKDRKTVAIYYELRKEDTNNDGKLDENDNITISLTSAQGLNYREIETNVTSVLDFNVNSEGSELTMLIQDRRKILLKKYSLATNQFIAEKEITRIGKKL